MNYKKANGLSGIFCAVGICLSFMLLLFPDGGPGFVLTAVAALLFVAAGAAIKIMFYRCPHCGKLLPLRNAFIDYCPGCGDKLEK
jgi:hypothetical protein